MKEIEVEMLWDFEHMLIKYLWVVDEDLEGKKLPTFDYVPCRYKRNYDIKYGMLWSNVWKWRVKERIRRESKVACDILPGKEDFLTKLSFSVLINDGVVCNQSEGK